MSAAKIAVWDGPTTLRVSDSDGRAVQLSLQPYREGWSIEVYVPTGPAGWRRLGYRWCHSQQEAVTLAPRLAADLLDLPVWQSRPARLH